MQELEYDAWGNITGIVDGNRNRTQYQLDPWGRIIGIIKADGSTEQYTYDFAGNMTSSTDGEGHTTQYQYNRMGKIAAIVDPMGGQERYAYDGQGRMVRKTDRNGVTVEFGYNLYGAPLFKRTEDGALGDFYEYTPEGLLKCAISAGMRYAYEYDVMGRLARKSASGRTLLAMVYDKNGNKIRQTDVAGKTTDFTYSPLDLLLKMYDDGTELAAYDYNPDGTIRALAHGPIRQEYAYDLDKNLTALKVLSAGAVLADNLYQYDGNGNRTLKRQLGGDTLYHYDPLNQLKKVEYPTCTEELFYDRAGNRIRRIAGGAEELYQYDPRNRLTAYTKGNVTTPFQYDEAGNLLADDKALYSYDSFNRTVKAETFDGNIQINRYDAEGLRYEMEENGRLVRFIFNQDREAVAEEDASGLNRLIRGTELIASRSSADSARTYYHYASDEMGSATHIVDEAGVVQNRYEYDAWGNITAKEEQVPNRFTYYGQQIDPITQQYYLRARFYNPIIGRFIQEDIYRGDGLNLYAYCKSNPVYYFDPSGYYKDAPMNAATGTSSSTALVPYDPNFAATQRAIAGEIYRDSHGDWHEVGGDGKYTFKPTWDKAPTPSRGSLTDAQKFGKQAEKIADHATPFQYGGFTYAGDAKIGSDNGFDQVYRRTIELADGTTQTQFLVVEVKGIQTGHSPQLSVLDGKTTRGIVQMSDDWIKMNINKMISIGTSKQQALGNEMKLAGIENIIKDIAVVRPDGSGYSVEYLGQQKTADLIAHTQPK